MSSNLSHIQTKVRDLFKLDLRNKSPKGWMLGGICPWCNRKDKFGIKFNEKSTEYKNRVSFNCFHGSCGEKGSEYKLLTEIGQEHLLKHGEFIGDKDRIEARLSQSTQDEEKIGVPTLPLPFGFRRVNSDPYLVERGFEEWQFQEYHIGRTKLDSRLMHYVLFLIIEGGENKGYVGRLTWHPSRIAEYEVTTGNKMPKYKNEGGADFGKLLFGIDEITEGTEEVLLVEGVTDKANVDRKLQLHLDDRLKCLCTFGKKVSDDQIEKLVKKKVSKVTLLYDPDAINESKKHSFNLQAWDLDVKVGYLSSKDPGDLTLIELQEILSKTQSPFEFSMNKIQKRKLK